MVTFSDTGILFCSQCVEEQNEDVEEGEEPPENYNAYAPGEDSPLAIALAATYPGRSWSSLIPSQIGTLVDIVGGAYITPPPIYLCTTGPDNNVIHASDIYKHICDTKETPAPSDCSDCGE